MFASNSKRTQDKMWTQTQSRTRKATDKYVIPYFKLVIIPRIVCFPVRYYSVISLRVFLFYRLNSRFYRWIVRFKAAHLEETEGRFTFAFIIISKRNLLETFLHLFEKDLILFRKLFGLFWKLQDLFIMIHWHLLRFSSWVWNKWLTELNLLGMWWIKF